MTALFKTEDNFAYHDNGDIECCLCGSLVRSSTTHWKWHDRESSSTSAGAESTESTLTKDQECDRCGLVGGHSAWCDLDGESSTDTDAGTNPDYRITDKGRFVNSLSDTIREKYLRDSDMALVVDKLWECVKASPDSAGTAYTESPLFQAGERMAASLRASGCLQFTGHQVGECEARGLSANRKCGPCLVVAEWVDAVAAVARDKASDDRPILDDQLAVAKRLMAEDERGTSGGGQR